MQKFYEAYQFYGYRESEIGGVLTTANQGIRGDTPLIVTYSEKRFFEWHEDDKSVNIRASSGSYGGSNEVLVCYPIDLMTATHFTERDNRRGIGVGDNGDVAFTISAGHSHGVAYVSKANHRKEE